MLYRHVVDKISTEFRGILRVFVNFAGFSRIYLNFAAPQPYEISEALFAKTIIPLAFMASESTAHSAFGLMGY